MRLRVVADIPESGLSDIRNHPPPRLPGGRLKRSKIKKPPLAVKKARLTPEQKELLWEHHFYLYHDCPQICEMEWGSVVVTPTANRNTYSIAIFFYILTQGRGASPLNPGLCNRNSFRVAKGAPPHPSPRGGSSYLLCFRRFEWLLSLEEGWDGACFVAPSPWGRLGWGRCWLVHTPGNSCPIATPYYIYSRVQFFARKPVLGKRHSIIFLRRTTPCRRPSVQSRRCLQPSHIRHPSPSWRKLSPCARVSTPSR